jgi:hypothetical protein
MEIFVGFFSQIKINVARWLFLSHFLQFLDQASYFDAVVINNLSIILNQSEQI